MDTDGYRMVCRVCGGEVVEGRYAWGHTTNPGAAHHYAEPVTPTEYAADRTPHRADPGPEALCVTCGRRIRRTVAFGVPGWAHVRRGWTR